MGQSKMQMTSVSVAADSLEAGVNTRLKFVHELQPSGSHQLQNGSDGVSVQLPFIIYFIFNNDKNPNTVAHRAVTPE